MAQRTNNTMAEALEKIRAIIAGSKVVADMDLPFITELETMVVGKLRELNGVPAMQQQGMIPQGPPQSPPGMPPPMPGPPPGMGDMQSGGMRPGNGPANPDELRRILGGAQ